ncbi:MAG: hypothetical protein A2X76_05025 [Lysobacterales bacterium GWF1_69_6]|nr:MAG: hypothetical protein A2X76_05025 [Xanthomonadales bacterium GWF1_69_6]
MSIPADLKYTPSHEWVRVEADGTLTIGITHHAQDLLGDMVFTVAEVINELSKLYALKAGDLVFMGTPAGVAALQPGDVFQAGVEGLVEFGGRIA